VEEMMGETMEDVENGINIGGFLLKNIRFTDDQSSVPPINFYAFQYSVV